MIREVHRYAVAVVLLVGVWRLVFARREQVLSADGRPNPTDTGYRASPSPQLDRNGQSRTTRFDRLLNDYRPPSVEDILRFDSPHWYRGWSKRFNPARKGYVEPLFRTNRMRVRPLRSSGFLYRLERGIAKVTNSELPSTARYCGRRRASSDRQRARVIADVKARRSAPLRGAHGLDAGSRARSSRLARADDAQS